jgi:2-amino-4-hydroxy-6-hydroxymethyldihydropteridine diphosphokinase
LSYIALGSNLENPESQLTQALRHIGNITETQLLKASSLYRSAAIGGPKDQPNYINAVCAVQTTLSPIALLRELQAIEQQAGRVRDVRWGPRTLDLDIIWIENESSDNPTLTLPHPRAHERAFVIKPLLELQANFSLNNQPLEHWNRATAHQSIQLID